MKHHFWHNRWERNEIGFHQTEINPFLCRFFPELGLAENARVFVPLCGKTLDLLWLRDQGHRVIGVELSEQAVRAFFAENRVEPQVEQHGPFLSFFAENLQLLCGDFFELTPDILGPVAAVYDRAALVALPPEMRSDYACHLAGLLAGGTEMLTLSYTYKQEQMDGPPFAVRYEEVQSLFGELFQVEQVISEPMNDLPQRFRAAGLFRISEEVYRLVRL